MRLLVCRCCDRQGEREERIEIVGYRLAHIGSPSLLSRRLLPSQSCKTACLGSGHAIQVVWIDHRRFQNGAVVDGAVSELHARDCDVHVFPGMWRRGLQRCDKSPGCQVSAVVPAGGAMGWIVFMLLATYLFGCASAAVEC